MTRFTLPIAVGTAAVALLAAGPSAFGRLALLFGLPSIAAPLLEDPAWRGVALYRSGQFEAADEAFAAAGSRATFNRANALARGGRYELALAYYDAVLFREPADDEARENRALVASLVDTIIGEGEATPGVGILPHVAGAAAEAGKGISQGTPWPAGTPEERVIRQRSAQSVVASRQWLATLADEPGVYLKLRLAAEHRRRVALGIAAPAGGDPW